MTREVKKHVELEITPASIGSVIKINGIAVPNVRDVKITAGVGYGSEVVLTITCPEVSITGQVKHIWPVFRKRGSD